MEEPTDDKLKEERISAALQQIAVESQQQQQGPVVARSDTLGVRDMLINQALPPDPNVTPEQDWMNKRNQVIPDPAADSMFSLFEGVPGGQASQHAIKLLESMFGLQPGQYQLAPNVEGSPTQAYRQNQPLDDMRVGPDPYGDPEKDKKLKAQLQRAAGIDPETGDVPGALPRSPLGAPVTDFGYGIPEPGGRVEYVAPQPAAEQATDEGYHRGVVEPDEDLFAAARAGARAREDGTLSDVPYLRDKPQEEPLPEPTTLRGKLNRRAAEATQAKLELWSQPERVKRPAPTRDRGDEGRYDALIESDITYDEVVSDAGDEGGGYKPELMSIAEEREGIESKLRERGFYDPTNEDTAYGRDFDPEKNRTLALQRFSTAMGMRDLWGAGKIVGFGTEATLALRAGVAEVADFAREVAGKEGVHDFHKKWEEAWGYNELVDEARSLRNRIYSEGGEIDRPFEGHSKLDEFAGTMAGFIAEITLLRMGAKGALSKLGTAGPAWLRRGLYGLAEGTGTTKMSGLATGVLESLPSDIGYWIQNKDAPLGMNLLGTAFGAGVGGAIGAFWRTSVSPQHMLAAMEHAAKSGGDDAVAEITSAASSIAANSGKAGAEVVHNVNNIRISAAESAKEAGVGGKIGAKADEILGGGPEHQIAEEVNKVLTSDNMEQATERVLNSDKLSDILPAPSGKVMPAEELSEKLMEGLRHTSAETEIPPEILAHDGLRALLSDVVEKHDGGLLLTEEYTTLVRTILSVSSADNGAVLKRFVQPEGLAARILQSKVGRPLKDPAGRAVLERWATTADPGRAVTQAAEQVGKDTPIAEVRAIAEATPNIGSIPEVKTFFDARPTLRDAVIKADAGEDLVDVNVAAAMEAALRNPKARSYFEVNPGARREMLLKLGFEEDLLDASEAAAAARALPVEQTPEQIKGLKAAAADKAQFETVEGQIETAAGQLGPKSEVRHTLEGLLLKAMDLENVDPARSRAAVKYIERVMDKLDQRLDEAGIKVKPRPADAEGFYSTEDQFTGVVKVEDPDKDLVEGLEELYKSPWLTGEGQKFVSDKAVRGLRGIKDEPLDLQIRGRIKDEGELVEKAGDIVGRAREYFGDAWNQLEIDGKIRELKVTPDREGLETMVDIVRDARVRWREIARNAETPLKVADDRKVDDGLTRLADKLETMAIGKDVTSARNIRETSPKSLKLGGRDFEVKESQKAFKKTQELAEKSPEQLLKTDFIAPIISRISRLAVRHDADGNVIGRATREQFKNMIVSSFPYLKRGTLETLEDQMWNTVSKVNKPKAVRAAIDKTYDKIVKTNDIRKNIQEQFSVEEFNNAFVGTTSHRVPANRQTAVGKARAARAKLEREPWDEFEPESLSRAEIGSEVEQLAGDRPAFERKARPVREKPLEKTARQEISDVVTELRGGSGKKIASKDPIIRLARAKISGIVREGADRETKTLVRDIEKALAPLAGIAGVATWHQFAGDDDTSLDDAFATAGYQGVIGVLAGLAVGGAGLRVLWKQFGRGALHNAPKVGDMSDSMQKLLKLDLRSSKSPDVEYEQVLKEILDPESAGGFHAMTRWMTKPLRVVGSKLTRHLFRSNEEFTKIAASVLGKRKSDVRQSLSQPSHAFTAAADYGARYIYPIIKNLTDVERAIVDRVMKMERSAELFENKKFRQLTQAGYDDIQAILKETYKSFEDDPDKFKEVTGAIDGIRRLYTDQLVKLHRAGLITAKELENLKAKGKMYAGLIDELEGEKKILRGVEYLDIQQILSVGNSVRVWHGGFGEEAIETASDLLLKSSKFDVAELLYRDAFSTHARVFMAEHDKIALEMADLSRAGDKVASMFVEDVTLHSKKEYDALMKVKGSHMRGSPEFKEVDALIKKMKDRDKLMLARQKELRNPKVNNVVSMLDPRSADVRTVVLKGPIVNYYAALSNRITSKLTPGTSLDSTALKVMRTFKNLKRWGVVVTPGFIARNFVRDAWVVASQRPIGNLKQNPLQTAMYGSAGAGLGVEWYNNYTQDMIDEERGKSISLGTLLAGAAGGAPSALMGDVLFGIIREWGTGLAHHWPAQSKMGQYFRKAAVKTGLTEEASEEFIEGYVERSGREGDIQTIYDELLASGQLSLAFYPVNDKSLKNQGKILSGEIKTIRGIKEFGEGVAALPVAGMKLAGAVGRAIETAPRMYAWRQVSKVLKEGDASKLKAIGGWASPEQAAREVSIDFNEFGGSYVFNTMADYTAFLRPQALGQRKLWDTFRRETVTSKQPGKWKPSEFGLEGHTTEMNQSAIAMGVGTITIPSMALWALNHDNPEYKARAAWEKNLFWLIPRTGGGFYRVPKPFEYGIIFGSLPERMADFFVEAFADDGEIPGTHGNLGTDVLKTLGEVGVGMMSVFGGWPIPDFATSFSAAMIGYDTFRRRMVDPGWLSENQPKWRQATEFDSYTATYIAENIQRHVGLDVSAARVRATLEGTIGSMGSLALEMADDVSRAMGINENPERIVGVNRYHGFTTGITPRFEAESEVMKAFREGQEAYRSAKREVDDGNIEAAREYLKDDLAKIITYRYIEDGVKQLDSLRKLRDEVMKGTGEARGLTPEMRTKVVRHINYSTLGAWEILNQQIDRVMASDLNKR
jgi:hypothetical protein